MNITTDELILAYGMSQIENLKLRTEVNRLQAELNGWRAEAQRLQADTHDNGIATDADTAVLHRP